MREEQELSAAMERVLKLADYLVSVPTDHYTRRPPHPYEGHPSCANRQAADDLRTVLHATRSNPPQEERSDPLDLAAADDNHKALVEALKSISGDLMAWDTAEAARGAKAYKTPRAAYREAAAGIDAALAAFQSRQEEK